MADYKGIKGFKIPNVSSDPSNPIPGQIWYNSTSGTLKGQVYNATGTWASGGTMNTARAQTMAGGNSTLAIVAGGAPPPGGTESETYDGTSWTEGNDLNNISKMNTGTGTYNSALSIAGVGVDKAESWNGTSWTEISDVNVGRAQAGGAGASNTSGMFFGGEGPSPWTDHNDKTETWNGTSWTEVNDLNTARTQIAGCGITTSALAAAGYDGSGYSGEVELWNGTSWTTTTSVNTALEGRMAFAADNTSSIVSGGRSPYQGITEQWNGSTWTEVNDLATARYNASASGSSANGILQGGSTSPSLGGSTTTEEWDASPATVTITTS